MCRGRAPASVDAARGADSPLVLGLSMSRLATLRRLLDRPQEAVPLLLDLLVHWDRLGDRPQSPHTIRESAMRLGLLGDEETAVRLLARAEQAQLVMPSLPIDRAHAGDLGVVLGERLGAHAFAAASEAGVWLTRPEAVVLAARSLADMHGHRRPGVNAGEVTRTVPLTVGHATPGSAAPGRSRLPTCLRCADRS